MVMFPVFEKHLTELFENSLCGLKKLPKRDLTYNLSEVTCMDCLIKSREEAIETAKVIANKIPHCPHCGGIIASVTLSFTVTVAHRFDIQVERNSDGINPLLYSGNEDMIERELVPEKKWQVVCENDHEFFTTEIEPSDDMNIDGGQWYFTGKKDEMEETPLCPICLCDPSEHNWEAHVAEMRANG